MTLTEVSDKLIGYAHQGYALSKVKVLDDYGRWRTINDIKLETDNDNNVLITLKRDIN